MKSSEYIYLHGIAREIEWLNKLIVERMSNADTEYCALALEKVPPPVHEEDSAYSKFIITHSLTTMDRAIFILAVVPHIRPDLLDTLLLNEQVQYPTYSIVGGRRGISHNGFLPTLQTALFLLAGHNIEARHAVSILLEPDGKLIRSGLLSLDEVPENEPHLSAPLTVSQNALALLMQSRLTVPEFSSEFPAKLVQSAIVRSDLVLHKSTEKQIEIVKNRMLQHDTDLCTDDTGGIFVFFSGEHGTGKTSVASVIAKQSERPLYSIDCALLFSTHISETERKLKRIMQAASFRNAILLFKRSEAFFRKEVTSGIGDRMLAREAAFLLGELKSYNGVVIFSASDYRALSDDFMRMQQMIVHFPMPEVHQRTQLWTKFIPADISLADDVDLRKFADHFQISAAAIKAVVQFALIQMKGRGDNMLRLSDFEQGIQNEYHKMNRRLESQEIFGRNKSVSSTGIFH